MPKSKSKKNFEDCLARLEEIADVLESENIAIEEAIALYEEGAVLSKECFEILTKAELKVAQLKDELEKTKGRNDKDEE